MREKLTLENIMSTLSSLGFVSPGNMDKHTGTLFSWGSQGPGPHHWGAACKGRLSAMGPDPGTLPKCPS